MSEYLIAVLTRVVLPAGTGMWALTQLAREPTPAIGAVLGVIVIAGLFIGFNQLLKIFDDRYNPNRPRNGGGSA